jgi:hypothetical protein
MKALIFLIVPSFFLKMQPKNDGLAARIVDNSFVLWSWVMSWLDGVMVPPISNIAPMD